MTRGQLLRESLSFAMLGLKMQFGRRFLPIQFTETQRGEIARKVVENMKKHRDVWNLDEELPPPDNRPSPAP